MMLSNQVPESNSLIEDQTSNKHIKKYAYFLAYKITTTQQELGCMTEEPTYVYKLQSVVIQYGMVFIQLPITIPNK